MTRLRRLFGARARSAGAPATNHDRYPAWERSPHERYLQTLLTNTFGQTFYASQRELVADAASVHREMVALDPAFCADALVYARSEGFMRSQPIYGLAMLASVDGPHFERAFGGVIRTPNDLCDFATVTKALRGNHGGRRIKRVAGRWLADRMTPYWAIKYGGASRGYSLKDLVRIYHPKGASKAALFTHLAGKSTSLAELPQLAAYADLKRATTDDDRAAAIVAGRLPHEVVTPFIGSSRRLWSALVPQLPVFALLRHLAALERHGVLDAHREHVTALFTNPRVIEASKILPFRFLTAAGKVQSAWVKDALREALELSFASVPSVTGRTAVMLDRSGSMSGFMQTAALFAICTLRKAELNGRLLAFDHELEEVSVSARDSVLTQAQAIKARGGTNVALPMERLLKDRDRVDNIVMITDEQQNQGTPFVDVLDRYRAKVNPNVNVFIIDVSPYRHGLTPKADARTWYVYGWSDQALKFVALAGQGFGTLVDHVRSRAGAAA